MFLVAVKQKLVPRKVVQNDLGLHKPHVAESLHIRQGGLQKLRLRLHRKHGFFRDVHQGHQVLLHDLKGSRGLVDEQQGLLERFDDVLEGRFEVQVRLLGLFFLLLLVSLLVHNEVDV